jgi:hypothetical protein
LSYFPAPSNHEVIDTVDNYNLNQEGIPDGDIAVFQTATSPSGGLPVTNSVAGQAIGGAAGFNVDVVEYDAYTEDGVPVVDTAYNGAVTLVLTSAALASESTAGPQSLPFGAGSVVTVSAVNGVAHFGDVIVDQAGEGYILTAEVPLGGSFGQFSGGYYAAPNSSVQFSVTAAAVSQMVITTEPVSTFQFADVPMVVSLEDAFGNIINTDNYSVVDLSVDTGPSPFYVPVAGTASGGVVNFDLSFGVPGTYTLLASDAFEGFPSVISDSFTISAATTQERGLNGVVISAPVQNGQQERNGPIEAQS